jgi:hypothetical protein
VDSEVARSVGKEIASMAKKEVLATRLIGVTAQGSYKFHDRTCADDSHLVTEKFTVVYDFSKCTVDDIINLLIGGQSLSVIVGNYGEEAGASAVHAYLEKHDDVVYVTVNGDNPFLTREVLAKKAEKRAGEEGADALRAEERDRIAALLKAQGIEIDLD